MDVNEVWLRHLFMLMERGGWWPKSASGTDALHMVLVSKHGVSHLGGLKAAQLRDLVSVSAGKAKEKIG